MEIFSTVVGATDALLSLGSFAADRISLHRQCSMTVSNTSSNYTLCNPCMYIKSGKCTHPLPPSVGPTESGEAVFTKSQLKSNGCIGVVTYDMQHTSTQTCSHKVAVHFKVPFNQKKSPVWYALGIVDISTECNQDLCAEMSKGTTTAFVRGKAKGPSLSHKGPNVTVKATMSDNYEAVMKVQLCDN